LSLFTLKSHNHTPGRKSHGIFIQDISRHLICEASLPQISEQFYQQILSLQAKSKDHLTEKLAQLGVYDLQALKLAVGVLQSEAGLHGNAESCRIQLSCTINNHD